MRRIALALSVVALAGCGQAAPAEQGQLRSQDLTATERQAFVYAAAIRYLVDQGTTRQGPIFVLDRAMDEADEPVAQSNAGTPIPQGVQDRVREELALLGKVKFVAERGEVVGPAAEGGEVRNQGMLITLGPVPAGRDRVEVAASSYEGMLGGTWQTLVIKRHGLRWRVEDTTGPVAMS